MAEPVSLPPGSDNPPDSKPEPFTEEDVRLVAAAIAPEFPGAVEDPVYREDAARILRALAEAGRLLPASGEVTEDRGYRRKHRAGDGYTPTLLAGHRPANWQEGAQEMRRTTRRWRDGSQWTGPWEVVQ
jgi:hypothetical protein